MSFQRFTLYFVAVMACGVTAFPYWSTARPATTVSDQSERTVDYKPMAPAPPKAYSSERRKAPPRPA